MRKVIAALVVLALAFGGWWVYATYVMRDSATQLAAAVGSQILVVEENAEGLPDEEAIRRAITKRAEELGAAVTQLDVSVDVMELTERQPRPNQLEKILDRMRKNRVGMGPTRMVHSRGREGVSIRPEARTVARKYAVHGQIVVSHGIWSYEQPLDVEKVLQRQRVE